MTSISTTDPMPEKVFDDLAWLAAHVCCTPIALVSVAGGRGQRLKSKVGLTTQETAREFTMCDAALSQRKLHVVTDALQDRGLATDPLVTTSPKVRFFAGVPLITSNGAALGTLSVMDRVPRQLSPEQIYALEVLARQLVNHLEHREQGAGRRAEAR